MKPSSTSARIATTAVALATGMLTIAAAPAVASSRAKPEATWGTNGRVEAIVPVGNRIFIGGSFSSVIDTSGRSHPASNLAVFDPATGQFDLSWGSGADREVRALASENGTLYVGGDFTAINGRTERKLAAVDISTGQPITNWKAQPNRVIDSLAAVGGYVYVGGTMSTIKDSSGRHAVSNVGRVDAATGRWDSSWTPQPDARVRKVLASADGSHVFLGGDFGSVNGSPSTRSVASLFTSSGAVDSSFAVGPTNGAARPPVFDMTTDGSHLLLAVGGTGGACTAVAAGSGSVLWSKHSNGNDHAVAILDDVAYCGGHFSGTGSFDGQTRYKAAAVDLLSGQTLSFAPRINSALGVFDIAASGTNLYLGGDFTKISGESQPHFAMFSNP